MKRTIDAMRREIRSSPWKGLPAKTIFFGGGTPTFIPLQDLCALLEDVMRAHPPITNCEVTSEANPGTVDAAKFEAMRAAGFNRISIGAQSFQAEELRLLERVHAADDVDRAVVAARKAGFENINLDLMFALPKQSQSLWKKNLGRALSLGPSHLSLYCLTIEPNTAFYKRFNSGMLKLPSEECQVRMYETTIEMATAAGYEQYEISNFAKPGFQCRHNLEYWLGKPYVGYGPGAVGVMDGKNVGVEVGLPVRYTNLKHPARYANAVLASQTIAYEHEVLEPEIQASERVMLGLRLNDGISAESLLNKSRELEALRRRGWIEMRAGRVRLTASGRHFCSEVALQLM